MFTTSIFAASSKLANRLVRDEAGTEIVEYALLLGMIVCACIFFISALGHKIVGRWNAINDIFGDV